MQRSEAVVLVLGGALRPMDAVMPLRDFRRPKKRVNRVTRVKKRVKRVKKRVRRVNLFFQN